jgi:hypothetical protein
MPLKIIFQIDNALFDDGDDGCHAIQPLLDGDTLSSCGLRDGGV